MTTRWLRCSFADLLLLSLLSGAIFAQDKPRAAFIKIPGEGFTVSGYLAKPADDSPAPAILLVPGADAVGPNGAVMQAARNAAAQGFVALAVDYDPDHVSAQSALVRDVAEEQLEVRLTVAVEWLARQHSVIPSQPIGAVGWGRGADWVIRLVQKGSVGSAAIIDEKSCAAPQNLPSVPLSPILIVSGGCTPQRGQQLAQSLAATGSLYQVRTFEGAVEPFAAGPATSAIASFLRQAPKTVESAAKAPTAKPVVNIRDIMRVINSDDGVKGQLARVLTPADTAQVQWDQARSHAAVMLQSCDWLRELPPAKGSAAGWQGRVSDFRAALETLLKGVEQQDLPASQQALRRLPESCAACHRDYR